MISIEDKHLVLQPRINSSVPRLRLPLLSGYKCPMCEEVVHAAVKVDAPELIPRINFYIETLTGFTVHYNAVPLAPANGEYGALFLENGHNRPIGWSDSGRNTSGTCGVTKLVIEPNPLRRVLQFFRILLHEFPQSKPYDMETVAASLLQHPERAATVEAALVKKGAVVMPDLAGSDGTAYALRFFGWSQWTTIKVARAANEDTVDQDL